MVRVADIPETHYAKVGESEVAYQVFGNGPPLTFMVGFLSHIDLRWEQPEFQRFMRMLASFSTVVLFDRRGTGASDSLPEASKFSWEAWVDDIDAVMAAAGIEQTALVASNDAGPAAMLFAATFPEKVTSLVLTNTGPRVSQNEQYPFGIPEASVADLVSLMERQWGKDDPVLAQLFVPDRAHDPVFVKWYAKLQRATMTPSRVRQMWEVLQRIDALPALPLIQAPTVVVALSDSPFIPPEAATFLAEKIPNARTVTLQGGNGGATWLNEPSRYISEIKQQLLGQSGPVEIDRVLATVLFSDIDGSTQTASRIGDERWREVLDRHDDVARKIVEGYSGRFIKSTGDGVLATFDGPARAVRCAAEMNDQLAAEGISTRAGLHAGEVELRADDITGIAVHIASRVQELAAPGEILVSGTVKDLVVGSELSFSPKGRHALKGVPGEWEIFAYQRT